MKTHDQCEVTLSLKNMKGLEADRDKYAFFSLAALELARSLDWTPDLIHANDWHTALALYALHSRRTDPKLMRIRTLLTVHNLPYTGGDGKDVLSAYGLMPLQDSILPFPTYKQSSSIPRSRLCLLVRP